MVERLIAPVLKTGEAQAFVGSNPTPSATSVRLDPFDGIANRIDEISRIAMSEQLDRELRKALDLKSRQRVALSNLTFEEKYEMVRAMQKRHAEITGKARRIWPPLENAE